jgi:hypothetical protein
MNFNRVVIGGKSYDGGNHVWIQKRYIMIEYDSDFHISKEIKAKNWMKMALKEVRKIPNPVTIEWLIKNGYNVPAGIRKYHCIYD